MWGTIGPIFKYPEEPSHKRPKNVYKTVFKSCQTKSNKHSQLRNNTRTLATESNIHSQIENTTRILAKDSRSSEIQPDAADPDGNTFYKNIVEAEAT